MAAFLRSEHEAAWSHRISVVRTNAHSNDRPKFFVFHTCAILWCKSFVSHTYRSCGKNAPRIAAEVCEHTPRQKGPMSK